MGQPRGTQRYRVVVRADEDALTRAILATAAQYGRFGYRRIARMVNDAGGGSARTACSGSGVARGLRFPENSPNGAAFGSTTGPVSG